MGQSRFEFMERPTRCELPHYYWSTVNARGFVGARCIDLAWPWLTFA